ncbi:VOC family protein [Psychroserpens damuponensis]|uniref:VOC family protein n=1 Tax=Psychroserpens damuponensis TaxID=943936 RepID=UPI00058FA282|nr:VOC family protein [Psychroserpens damuponensis]
MSQPNNNINYVELYANDLDSIKSFYTNIFDWTFTDYGPNYTSFSNSGLAGGFEKTNKPIVNGALIVIHHHNLEEIKQKISAHGCTISVDIFSFPGGKRFQFIHPSGNELAVWTEA